MKSKTAILISSVAMTTLFSSYVEELMLRSLHVLKISFSETGEILASWLAPPANYHDGCLLPIAKDKVSSLSSDLFIYFLQGCQMTGCLNGGSCIRDIKRQTFSCACQQPWIGERCHMISLGACGGGEWTLVMKINGSQV